MTYHFILPIEPRAQKRDRIAVIGGHARSYKDTGQSHYEAKIRALLAGDAPKQPIEGPVSVRIFCCLPVPASWSKKKRTMALQRLIRPTTKPDVDNIAKAMLDCMSGLIFRDDKQVIELMVSKRYSDNPHWQITVEEL